MSIPALDEALVLCRRAALRVPHGPGVDSRTFDRVVDAADCLQEAGADPRDAVAGWLVESDGRSWVELLRDAQERLGSVDGAGVSMPAALLIARIEIRAAIRAGERESE